MIESQGIVIRLHTCRPFPQRYRDTLKEPPCVSVSWHIWSQHASGRMRGSSAETFGIGSPSRVRK